MQNNITVKYNGSYPCLCFGELIVTINEDTYTFPNNCMSPGGYVSFDDEGTEEVGDGTIAKNGSKNARVIHITAHKLWKSFYEELINFLDYPFIIKEYNGILRISLYQREFINKLNMFNCPKLNRKWIKI